MGNNCNNYPYSSEDGNGRGGSPPSLMDHSPNPTVTDEENGTDCETCAGTDHNISCYNCSPTAVDQFHESRPQLPWVQAGRPKSEHTLLHHGADDNNNNNNILNNNNSPNNHHHHLGQSNINNNIKSCNFSVYDVYDTKTFNMAFRPGFNPFTPTSDLTSLQQRGGSLQRPKTEPSTFCEGEDEAQSSQRELVPDYGSCWTSTDQAAVTSMYNNHTDPNCPAAPSLNNNLQSLQTGGATESSCVTDLSLPYSGENSSLFRYKYGLLDVAGPAVETGLEILWAYWRYRWLGSAPSSWPPTFMYITKAHTHRMWGGRSWFASCWNSWIPKSWGIPTHPCIYYVMYHTRRMMMLWADEIYWWRKLDMCSTWIISPLVM